MDTRDLFDETVPINLAPLETEEQKEERRVAGQRRIQEYIKQIFVCYKILVNLKILKMKKNGKKKLILKNKKETVGQLCNNETDLFLETRFDSIDDSDVITILNRQGDKYISRMLFYEKKYIVLVCPQIRYFCGTKK